MTADEQLTDLLARQAEVQRRLDDLSAEWRQVRADIRAYYDQRGGGGDD